MDNNVALWSAISAFFGAVLAIGAIDILDPNGRVQFIGALIVALITGGAVYVKQRLDDAKEARVHAGDIVVTETKDRLTYSLELKGDPENLQNRKEVIFRVRKSD